MDDPPPEKRSDPNLPQQIPHLPPEIITVILARLPVKSLLQFRSVSKSWRSIISDPKFVKTHLKICSENDEIAHHRLILRSFRRRGDPETIQSCHLSPVLNGFPVNPTELDYPTKQSPDRFDYVQIVGSVNGLIAIAVGKRDIFLWNPATRISKKLPHSGVKQGCGYLHVVYGFCYDERTDDYKCVGVFGTPGNGAFGVIEVMVYSLRTDCWRRNGDFPKDCAPMGGTGKFLNGAFHWASCFARFDGSHLLLSKAIVSFDLAKETFSEVPQPNYGEGELTLSLDVLGECLFVISDRGRRECMHVWMMKEYGVRESWTKLASLPYLNGPDHDEHPLLLYMSKEGEIVLLYGLRIWLYDLKNNSFRNPDIQNFDGHHEACAYIESLVSPLTQEGPERQQ